MDQVPPSPMNHPPATAPFPVRTSERYQWICGNDSDIFHLGKIEGGAYSEVHKVHSF